MNGIVRFRLCDLSDSELLNRVDRGTDKLYQTGEVPARPIPAKPNDDYDLLVGELIMRFQDRIKGNNGEHITQD